MRFGEIFCATVSAAVRAGTIASSTGSATAAPMPRNSVRRETCFRVRIISHRLCLPAIVSSPVRLFPFGMERCRRFPRSEPRNDNRWPRDPSTIFPDRTSIVSFKPAAESIDHQLFGQTFGKRVAIAEPELPFSSAPVERSCRPAARRSRRSAGRRRACAMADGIVVFERETERVHRRVARSAHRIGAVLFHLLPHGAGEGPPLASIEPTPGGGGGGGVFSTFSSIHLPRSTGEVRVG